MRLRRWCNGAVGTPTIAPVRTNAIELSNALQESLLAQNDNHKGIRLRIAACHNLGITLFPRCNAHSMFIMIRQLDDRSANMRMLIVPCMQVAGCAYALPVRAVSD